MQIAALYGCCFFALLGALFCTSGLFGLDLDVIQVNVSPQSVNHGAATDKSGYTTDKAFDRMVFVVIDALRADMVLGNEAIKHTGEDLSQYMPYTSQLARSKDSIAYIAHAAVPTVTMPRLKALTTGKKPAFIDVLRNFNSKELEEDNIIKRFNEASLKIVMYGDETWLDLFPNTFLRHDGTSGFFTKDIVEVDTNVTRHLVDELDPTLKSPKSQDWDILILHYLGVDHVGHSEGPHSSQMKFKLAEMDHVIQSIQKSIVAQDTLRESKLPTLFVLCSDHGMTETGSHGGASVEESSALMLFSVPKKYTSKEKSQGFHRALQVDLVPTLSVLLGVPIPESNTGILLNEVVDNFLPDSSLAKIQNLKQLRQLASQKWSPAEEKAFETMFQSMQLQTTLDEALRVLQEKLMESDGSEYNLFAIGLGVLCSMVGLFLAITASWPNIPRILPVHYVIGIGLILQVASYGSSSAIENEHATWNFILTSLWLVLSLDHLAKRDYRLASQVLILAATTRILRCRNQVINFARLNDLPSLSSTSNSQIGFEYELDDSLSILTTRSILDGAMTPLSEQLFAICCIGMYGCWKISILPTQRPLFTGLFLFGVVCSCVFAIDQSFGVFAHLVYASICIIGGCGLFMARSGATFSILIELVCWLLCTLLQSDTNMSALIVLCVQQFIFYKWAKHTRMDDFVITAAGFWMSKCGFYALGNSHLMTTINFTKAYTGLTEFSHAIVGFFTFFIVMSGPSVVLTSTLSSLKSNANGLSVVWVFELVSFLVYSVIMYGMRFHLFIWSVFAPKMMYQLAFLLWTILLTCILCAK